MKPSKLGKSDCKIIHRKIEKVNDLMFEYAMNGFPKEGYNNDFMLCVALTDLYETIGEKVNK
jgi:hypothetical protein